MTIVVVNDMLFLYGVYEGQGGGTVMNVGLGQDEIFCVDCDSGLERV